MVADVLGNRLRGRPSEGGETLIFLPTSPTRFQTAYDGLNLVFRLEEGRAAGLTLERAGKALGEELKRVP